MMYDGVFSVMIRHTDPHLTSQYAIQFAKGVQEGEDARYEFTVEWKHHG